MLIVNKEDVAACLELLAAGGETGACVMGNLVGGGSGKVLMKCELK